ncbi:MAG: hypothetical protein EA383_05330 [Spirochaetaceae bacterium]|nr:MAG: hypothetical protein EA383_05330 [Spirochaetaceae bacterium]
MKPAYQYVVMRALVLFSAFLAAGGACDIFSGTRTVDLHTPELPPSWQGFAADLRFDVTVNGFQEGSVTAGDTLNLAIPAEGPSVILVLPRLALRGVSLLPAGAVVRDSEDTVWASWEDGPLATILRQVAEAGYPLRRVNTVRLREEISTRAGRHAWSIRIPQVVDAIVNERLRVYDLTPQSAVDVTLNVSGVPGGSPTWFTADPLNPEPVELLENGQPALSLPPGTHLLLTIDAVHVLAVQVYEDGTAVAISR